MKGLSIMLLWTLIETISQFNPSTKISEISGSMNIELRKNEESHGNIGYISKIDITQDKKSQGEISFLYGADGNLASVSMNLSGLCITKSEIEYQLGDFSFIIPPRSPAPGASTYFGKEINNKVFLFSFKNASPDCLNGFGVNFRKNIADYEPYRRARR
ncbi:hypothetical protein ACNQFN_11150 [Thauera butanivorans]|uniref:hypothetical protein n=1 Tax=Thauera butanivorans TaxID=86174 RepID=UPI003AB611CD